VALGDVLRIASGSAPELEHAALAAMSRSVATVAAPRFATCARTGYPSLRPRNTILIDVPAKPNWRLMTFSRYRR